MQEMNLNKTFFEWYIIQPKNFKVKLIFLRDNQPSHSVKYFIGNRLKDTLLMKWPPVSPDINPIENLCSIIKSDVHENGKQYFCEAI